MIVIKESAMLKRGVRGRPRKHNRERKRVVILGGGFAASWLLDLLLPTELVQLKLDDSEKLAREHFEPGREVFCQGDLGDRVYIIVKGRAEVLREEEGRTIKLAEPGPGEYFGEAAVLNNTTRNATVRCTEAMDVLSVPKRQFMLMAAALPNERQRFEEVMAERERATALALAQHGV